MLNFSLLMGDNMQEERLRLVNFKINDEGKRALVRCPECAQENYAMNVMLGICTWCGFDINEAKKDD